MRLENARLEIFRIRSASTLNQYSSSDINSFANLSTEDHLRSRFAGTSVDFDNSTGNHRVYRPDANFVAIGIFASEIWPFGFYRGCRRTKVTG